MGGNWVLHFGQTFTLGAGRGGAAGAGPTLTWGEVTEAGPGCEGCPAGGGTGTEGTGAGLGGDGRIICVAEEPAGRVAVLGAVGAVGTDSAFCGTPMCRAIISKSNASLRIRLS